MRGSDADAALYWLARMLEAGEDSLYVARRLVSFASEDIGLANSRALRQAVAAYQACHLSYAGMQCYSAQAWCIWRNAKNSNELYLAYNQASADVKKIWQSAGAAAHKKRSDKVNGRTGYGKDYKYSPKFNYQENRIFPRN